MSLVRIAQRLSRAVAPLKFQAPVTHVYNPLQYAMAAHRSYLERFGAGPKEALFLGMNPGPWGMVQTGVPFGEVSFVRDWLKIDAKIRRPKNEHPKRPVLGLECTRSEVSGARLWGFIKDRFGQPERFFERFLIVNYCPLVFMEASGKNRTPDKLPAEERAPLLKACDRALLQTVELLQPKLVIGVGAFAEARAKMLLSGVTINRVLHPSPASPIANRGWAKQAAKELDAMGIDFAA